MSRIQKKIAYPNKNQENYNSSGRIQSGDAYTRMTKMLELFHKDFETAVIKMCKYIIKNPFETKDSENLMKEIYVIKKEQNGHFRTERLNNGNWETCWVYSVVELRWQGIESVELNAYQEILPNLKNREKTDWKKN